MSSTDYRRTFNVSLEINFEFGSMIHFIPQFNSNRWSRMFGPSESEIIIEPSHAVNAILWCGFGSARMRNTTI